MASAILPDQSHHPYLGFAPSSNEKEKKTVKTFYLSPAAASSLPFHFLRLHSGAINHLASESLACLYLFQRFDRFQFLRSRDSELETALEWSCGVKEGVRLALIHWLMYFTHPRLPRVEPRKVLATLATRNYQFQQWAKWVLILNSLI